MELRHIRYFLAVAEERHFTRAAARLNIAQPPLSQQIKDLEREIGATLFKRMPYGAELTEAGKAFLNGIKDIPLVTDHAVKAAQRALRAEVGKLRIGFTASAAFNAIVPTAIRNYCRTYPDVAVELSEGNTTLLVDGLNEGTLDIAFLRPGFAGSERFQLRQLDAEPLFAVLPETHRLASEKEIELSLLKGDAFLLFPRQIGLNLYDTIIDSCSNAGFEPKITQYAPQITSVINLVATELGISIVPASMQQVNVKGVVFRKIAEPTPVAELALAFRRGESSQLVKNFVIKTIS